MKMTRMIGSFDDFSIMIMDSGAVAVVGCEVVLWKPAGVGDVLALSFLSFSED